VAKKVEIKKKKIIQEAQDEKGSVIFTDEKANKPISLVYLGILAVVLGFLSMTPIMARTIFSESADFMVGMGLIGIIVGLIINNRKKTSIISNSKK
jgi:uncharacterized membrane protein HdeD (DUF308 family)